MKTAKTLLVLAIAMVLIMPSCKKDKFTKDSPNAYISLFKTAEELIGQDVKTAEDMLKKDNWSYDETQEVFTSSEQYLTFTMAITSTRDNKVHGVEYTIDSQSGMPERIKESFYAEFVTKQIGNSYKVNGNEKKFYIAIYTKSNGENKSTMDFDELKDDIYGFVSAKNAVATWMGEEAEGQIAIQSTSEGAKFKFICEMYE